MARRKGDRSGNSAARRARDDRVVSLHARGLTGPEIAGRVGLSTSGVYMVLRSRGIGPAQPDAALAARDQRIVALYKSGLSTSQVARKVRLGISGVFFVLRTQGVTRRSSGSYPKPEKRISKEIRRKVRRIAHLYDTGPGTSAVELARRIGVSHQAMVKYLREMGVKVRIGAGRAAPLTEKDVWKIKRDLVFRPELTLREIGARHGLTQSAICSIHDDESWKRVPWPAGKRYVRRPKNKLSPEQVQEIRRLGASGTTTLAEIARRYRVSVGAVTAILLKITWPELPWPRGVVYRRRVPKHKRKWRPHTRVLTEAQVREIKAALLAAELSFRELAERYGVGGAAISGIATGRTWKKVPWPGGKRYVRRRGWWSPRFQHRGVLRRSPAGVDSRGGEVWGEE